MSEILDFSYDDRLDVMTIEGVKYAGALFRSLANDMRMNTPIVITERIGGVIVLKELSLEELKEAVRDKETAES